MFDRSSPHAPGAGESGEGMSLHEVRMLRAVIASTAFEAARLGHAFNMFHRCQVRAWRVCGRNAKYVASGAVPIELTVTHCARLVLHEVGPVAAEAFDD
jgi:hypothetical protein